MRISTVMVSGLLVGATAGLGLFLIASVWLWRKDPEAPSRKMRPSWLESFATSLGIPSSLVAASMTTLSVITALLTYALTHVIALGVSCGVASIWLLPTIAGMRNNAVRKANRNIWPDAIDSLISALRSGANIPDAIISLENHKQSVIAAPVRQFAADYRLTGNFTQALNTLKSRWGSAQSDRIIETLRLGRDIGGPEITSVLATLGSQLRSESALRQELDARQGWVRVAARIGLVAPVIVVVVLSTRLEAVAAYNSAAGILLIIFGLVVTLLAYKFMIALGRLQSESRWLS